MTEKVFIIKCYRHGIQFHFFVNLQKNNEILYEFWLARLIHFQSIIVIFDFYGMANVVKINPSAKNISTMSN